MICLAVCIPDNKGVLVFFTDYPNMMILSFSLFCMPLSNTKLSVLISMILSIRKKTYSLFICLLKNLIQESLVSDFLLYKINQ